MKSRYLLYSAVCLLFLGMIISGTTSFARADPPTVIIRNERVSSSVGKNEVPRAAIGSDGTLHATWKFGGTPAQTQYATKPELTGNWAQQGVGPYAGSGTFFTSAVAVNPVDNTPHMVWADTSQGGDGRIFYSRRQTNGLWTAPVAISPNVARFAHYPSITVTKNGVIWALWSRTQGEGGADGLFYRYSTDNGATWQPGNEGLIDGSGARRGFITADKDGGVHITWWTCCSGGLQVKYGRWNGSSWSQEVIPAGGKNAESTIAIDGLNNIHLVWRRERAEAEWDIFYATKPVGGTSWNIAKLVEGGNIGQAPVVSADASNTVHVTWNAPAEGNRNVFYTQKIPGSSWLSPPLNITNNTLFNANHWVAARSDSGISRAHIFTETWYNGDADVRIEHHVVSSGTIQATPTPPPPTATPIPPVNFTLTRTSVSPTTNPNINASLTGFEGSPNEMRYSPTPFAANDTTVGWIGLQTAITVNTSSAVANCGVTIYAQVRNTNTGQVSAVKSVSAVVDTAVQSQVAIYTMEHAPQPRPATAQAPNEQNFAPDGADPNYTRSMTFVYRIPQEPVPCVGIKSYKVESFVRSPSPFPNLEEGIAPFQPFSTGLDVGGIGSPEQTVTANVVLTDTLNNQAAFAKTVFYDDDPPILVNGGSISFTNGITSSISVVPITFDADVTDDGYTNSAPANQKYWGVWVVATANATLPTPAVFAQYGRVHYVAPSSEQVDYVSLTNDSAPALRESGTRFVHIRFLDGAGNYSEQGITSPQITLSNPFQEGLRTYLPVIAR